MEDVKRKVFNADLAWHVLNHLEEFNSQPDLIRELSKKFFILKDHLIFGKFVDLFNEAVNYFDKHNSFPDIIYLNRAFPEGKLIKILKNSEFSMTLFEDLVKTLNFECLVLKFNNNLATNVDFDPDLCRDLAKDLLNFADTTQEVTKDTKEDLINSYDTYIQNYSGLETHMKELDNIIGVLGSRSLAVFAAGSGHGKSTFAISLAYLVATHGGVVDYVSFEITSRLLWFNLIAIESTYCYDTEDLWLPAYKIKEGKLDEQEKERYKVCMTSLLSKVKNSGGYLNIIDQTEIQFDTFEKFCASLESIAEERQRPADLIIIDNVDNLQVMRSNERDEATRVNQYIISLDKYVKTYCKGIGTTMLLLSQINRTGLGKVAKMEGKADAEISVDVTCIQKFNALYEKATVVMIGYSSPTMRTQGVMNVLPVKLRGRALPTRPIGLNANFEFSSVSGGYVAPKNNAATFEQRAHEVQTAQQQLEDDMGSIEDFM